MDEQNVTEVDATETEVINERSQEPLSFGRALKQNFKASAKHRLS